MDFFAGRLFSYGAVDQGLLLLAHDSVLPFQCIPLFFKIAEGLDELKVYLAQLNLPISLYLPRGFLKSQLGWLLFRGFLKDLRSDPTMLTLQQFLNAHLDWFLPINFQVDRSIMDYAKAMQQELRIRLFPEGVKALSLGQLDPQLVTKPVQQGRHNPQAGVYLIHADDVKLQWVFSSGLYNQSHQTYYEQIARLLVPQVNLADDPTTMNVLSTWHLMNWKTVYRYVGMQDVSNTLNMYCYDGRLEGYFFGNQTLPWPLLLDQFGYLYHDLLFSDAFLDQYVLALQQNFDFDLSDQVLAKQLQRRSASFIHQLMPSFDHLFKTAFWADDPFFKQDQIHLIGNRLQIIDKKRPLPDQTD